MLPAHLLVTLTWWHVTEKPWSRKLCETWQVAEAMICSFCRGRDKTAHCLEQGQGGCCREEGWHRRHGKDLGAYGNLGEESVAFMSFAASSWACTRQALPFKKAYVLFPRYLLVKWIQLTQLQCQHWAVQLWFTCRLNGSTQHGSSVSQFRMFDFGSTWCVVHRSLL